MFSFERTPIFLGVPWMCEKSKVRLHLWAAYWRRHTRSSEMSDMLSLNHSARPKIRRSTNLNNINNMFHKTNFPNYE